jgi:DNA-directed RNA polymerase sigma subunit (sigma70/sigma32)
MGDTKRNSQYKFKRKFDHLRPEDDYDARLQEIADEMGISSERVRQIQNSALRKFAHRMRNWKDYFER